jgi:hypothetical protein
MSVIPSPFTIESLVELTSAQISVLEKILNAGFRFVTVERAERYLGVEREGFVALLEPADGRIKLFGQAGYLMSAGIGMLVERREGKCFVWHDQSIRATPEMLGRYEKFKRELMEIVG